MKPTLPLMVLLAIFGEVQAQFTTLIGPGVRNGDFNDDTSTVDSRPYSQTPFRENIAGGQAADATRTTRTMRSTGRRTRAPIRARSSLPSTIPP